jgi:formate hydrogenlyase subunit 6/NADH:ubiquinone oxidoreductase subunit I
MTYYRMVGQMSKNETPIIDWTKCSNCGLCVSVCTCGALTVENNVVKIVEVDDCGWCTMCELVCPTGAISCPFEIVIEDDAK